MELLSTNAKLEKTNNGKSAYLTCGLQLAPAAVSGRNVCKHSTEHCRPPRCVAYTGHGPMPNTIAGRIRRTNMFFDDRETFATLLAKDIRAHIRKAKREGVSPAIRLNTFSDIPWERTPLTIDGQRTTVIDAFADDVTFYDYTKYPHTERPSIPTYHLTYSASGTNTDMCMSALAEGYNVAVVFSTEKGMPLPDEFWGYPVIDADETDLRFLDPQGAIAGLRVKAASTARKRALIKTPFVFDANNSTVEV